MKKGLQTKNGKRVAGTFSGEFSRRVLHRHGFCMGGTRVRSGNACATKPLGTTNHRGEGSGEKEEKQTRSSKQELLTGSLRSLRLAPTKVMSRTKKGTKRSRFPLNLQASRFPLLVWRPLKTYRQTFWKQTATYMYEKKHIKKVLSFTVLFFY